MDFLLKKQDYKAAFIARSKAGGGEGTDFLETDKAAAEEYSRIWDDLVCVFDSLAFCLAEQKVTAEKFTATLEAVLSGMTLANPPRTLDAVTIGDIERTRKAEPKYVFICGACEGDIPRRAAPNTNFSAAEQEELEENGLEVGGTRLFRYGKELFFAYRAVSSAKKRLYISYPVQGFSGAEKSPSSLIRSLNAPLSQNAEAFPIEFYARTRASTRVLIAEHYGTAAAQQLREALGSDDEYINRLDTANAFANGKGYNFSLSRETAEKIFASSEYSPTKLQTVFDCPFTHFCKYGLGLFDEEPQDVGSARVVGYIVHGVMREVLQNEAFFELSEADIKELISRSLFAMKPKLKKETGDTEKRVEAQLERLLPRLEKLLAQTRLELSDTGFRPAFFEKKVAYKLSLNNIIDTSDEKKMLTIVGQADRIDRLQADGSIYARICDYKTGSKKIDMNAVKNGLGLQPFLYLFAHCDESGDLPAVAQYVAAGAEKPMKYASTDSFNEAAQRKNWYSTHTTSAALISKDEENSVENGFSCHEANLRAITGASSRTSFIKTEKLDIYAFSELRDHIENELLVPKITALKSGKIDAIPTVNGYDKPCSYCSFKYFCNNKDGIFRQNSISETTVEEGEEE